MVTKSWTTIFLITVIILCLQANNATAFSSAPKDDPALPDHPALFDQVEEFRLDNGMLFLLLPRHDVPTFSGFIIVKVGNVDNPEGSTGLAHLFEHMAFKGTDYIGSLDVVKETAVRDSMVVVGNELSALVRIASAADSTRITQLRGEITRLQERENELIIPMEFARVLEKYTYNFNAYTSQDFTAYHSTLPTNNLEVWMLMESERLQNPVFREFYSELGVVKDERLMRSDDSPEGMAWEVLKSSAFSKHPYRYPTIGYEEDLDTLNPSQLTAFWRQYYAPANMVAALVGDFELAEAKPMIQEYFGDIPSGPVPSGPGVIEPEQEAMRRDSHFQGDERQLLMAFSGFAPNDPRVPAARMLGSILTRNKTSRLTRRLDIEEGVARSVYARAMGGYKRYRGLFTITVNLMNDATNKQVEDMVWQELDKLQTEPVSQEKLDEIRASYRKRFFYGLQRNNDIAETLAETQASAGDWRRVYQKYNDYDLVTVEDITKLAQELFARDKATVVYLEPEVADQDLEGVQP